MDNDSTNKSTYTIFVLDRHISNSNKQNILYILPHPTASPTTRHCFTPEIIPGCPTVSNIKQA